MKKLILIALLAISNLAFTQSINDTVYLNGTTQKNFALGSQCRLWFNGCTEYSCGTTVRTISGFGKVLFKTDGTGYVIPVAGAKATFEYHKKTCGLTKRYITFMTQVIDTVVDDTVIILPPPPTSTPYTIMGIGDSNTEGHPTTFPTLGSYRKRLDSLLGPNADFIGRKSGGNFTDNQHEGYSGIDIGAMTNDHVNQSMFTTNKPKYITLHIGYNDVNGFNGMSPNNDPIAEAPQRFNDLISAIQAKSPNSIIIVVALLPIYANSVGHGNVTKVQTFNSQIAQMMQTRIAAGQKIYYLDFFSKFDPSDYSDGLHLTVNGYNKLADELYSALIPIIANN